MDEKKFMALAIELAEKGRGKVNPNPLVGAVIVKDGEVIGRGYHEEYGRAHAEVNAINSSKKSLCGSTMYVTLEPCCHQGTNSPCTEAIIKSGISEVVVGTLDPNPIVAGKGVGILKAKGINVKVGFLEEECKELIKIFSHYIKTKTPYVTMKYAMTMDGKIATKTNKSKWITGDEARENVHKTRGEYAGIMVGINTVVNDDPMLTCRLEGFYNPIRIICDTNLILSLDSKIVRTARKVRTIIATCNRDLKKQREYINLGCEILVTDMKDGHINLSQLMKKLGEMKIDSILLEGGGTLNWSALEGGIVKSLQVYIAPKLFGGLHGISPIRGDGVSDPINSIKLSPPTVKYFGSDILLESEVLF
ncbi:bifunctional diaminohydroxyphosphoribosylaminopyrimidine deaminase/5-amino-6-(5-phosphoribosylamino)uracil reductase RibD [Miniphocaeibacter halophilus]|uniref:Bifunctional diaminohydroxyphosphoribosylaminopyrimidine deaminase/5-amino-6-(5-phosphoribosylamino)uracil reductase RibD n=1 Tax=Miniphocaeibacter halophilus TaxID=2931922 RepID=A0AC61MX55_9FIRM|nr:bifunctional diaminohydroxyphosphoribosylaminopyrimidine deaminase/5-amino-6-(5-phosphoribosylamino)uracil reductase RibD [Miniphocaeibacter halophilus]QQK08036.1 bifunctional diaminohydroxyphosphoribosylaminopyrimidine deaminase/5-amino-6-(5-phosphoribosylamino)uracil reductase RibD [Miniphocaeibacter halophilus]